ncbi:hypothetical protein FB451DRAFT_1162341 [Mycena latifolia]|nr:hypothetical protein FB451DRAFT_1162341 [Mycena latifolia]
MAVGTIPLSALPAADIAFDEDGVSLWHILLAAERVMIQESQASQLKTLLVGVRVVGHFFCEFCTPVQRRVPTGARRMLYENIRFRDTLPKTLNMCLTGTNLLIVRQHSGSLPKTSQHPSRPSMDTLMADIVQQIKNADQSKPSVKRPALARDGFKCVVSGLIDNPSYKAFPTAFPANALTCKTQCCHIFSESAQDGDEKTEYAGAAMAILKMFNFDFHSLLGSGVNTLHNVVTMDTELHNMWDDLEFWFEEVIGQPNTYNVVAAMPSFWTMVQRPQQQVTFTVDPDFAAKCAAEGVTPELPSRGLLAIRAAVSRVAHMSGAAEQYEIIMQYRETSTVMAYDGGSAELLQALVEISAAAFIIVGTLVIAVLSLMFDLRWDAFNNCIRRSLKDDAHSCHSGYYNRAAAAPTTPPRSALKRARDTTDQQDEAEPSLHNKHNNPLELTTVDDDGDRVNKGRRRTLLVDPRITSVTSDQNAGSPSPKCGNSDWSIESDKPKTNWTGGMTRALCSGGRAAIAERKLGMVAESALSASIVYCSNSPSAHPDRSVCPQHKHIATILPLKPPRCTRSRSKADFSTPRETSENTVPADGLGYRNHNIAHPDLQASQHPVPYGGGRALQALPHLPDPHPSRARSRRAPNGARAPEEVLDANLKKFAELDGS